MDSQRQSQNLDWLPVLVVNQMQMTFSIWYFLRFVLCVEMIFFMLIHFKFITTNFGYELNANSIKYVQINLCIHSRARCITRTLPAKCNRKMSNTKLNGNENILCDSVYVYFIVFYFAN